jgi:hypothetical protein
MATDQIRVKPAAPKYEAVVERHLGRALARIRLLDVAVAVLLVAAATLVYALVMILLDRALDLSATARQLAFLGYVLGVVAFLGFAVVWPLCRRINPYYAARRLEATLPEAKNSLVNWLDLRHRSLPPAIRGAVGHRAAEDARRVDVENAISGRRAAWFGGVTGALVLVLFITFLVFGPPQFFSLLGRTFLPFGGGVIKSQTTLEIVQPRGGDAVVPVGQPVAFSVHVGGKVPAANSPNAVKLLFRHRQTDPYEERPMECEQDRDYATILPAFQVQSGFWYKIIGGDAETPEHQVRVRSGPLVERIDVTYHYRPYLGWRDEVSAEPNLKALRGTEVTLIAHTNRRVRDGRMALDLKDGQHAVSGELVKDNDRALRFKLVLDQDGQYRISFTSIEGESNSDPAGYTITVIRDFPPHVELTKPGADTSLPANGLLELEGRATDDFGITGFTLRMRVVDGPALRPKPYRPGKDFKLVNGSYPKQLDYKDAVELDKVQDEQNKPVALQPKMVVEYWLEAADSCDFPGPNIGQSKHFHVTIGEPEKDAGKLAQQRAKAAGDQAKHEKAQNEKLDKENEAIKNQPKDRDANPEQQPSHEERQKIDETERQVQKGLNEEERKQNPDAGESKPDDQQQQPGEGKGDDKQDPQPDAGKGKDKGSPDAKQEPGQDKGDGTKQGDKPPQTGEDKNQGEGGQDQQMGAGKEEAGGQDGAGQSKDQGGGGQSGSDKSGGKDGGKGGDKPDAAKAKGGGAEDGGQQPDKGDAKSAGKDGKGSDQAPAGNAKPGVQESARSESKAAGKPGDESGKAKDDPTRTTGGDRASGKSAGAEPPNGKSTDKGEAKAGPRKPSAQSSDKNEKAGQDAKPEDVAKAAKDLQAREPSKLEEAIQKLAQMAQKALDPKAKEDARKALEKAFREPTGEPKPAAPKGGPKPEDPPKRGQAEPCECKKPGMADSPPGSTRQEGGSEGNSSKGEAKGRPTNPGGMGEEHGKGDPTGEAKGKAPGKGSQAKVGGSGGSGHTNKGQNGGDNTHKGGPGDERDRKKAGELLLQRFDQVVDKKKFLKDNGITEEQMRLLREDIARRGQRPADSGDRRPTKRITGGTLPDQGARRVQPGGPNRAGDAKYGGPGKPPAELRDLHNEFTSTVSQPEKAKDKK